MPERKAGVKFKLFSKKILDNSKKTQNKKTTFFRRWVDANGANPTVYQQPHY